MAGCVTAPSGGSVTYTITKLANIGGGTTSVGTIAFADGATTGTPYIQQTAYEVSNTLFTTPDFYSASYQYLLTLSEFAGGILEVQVLSGLFQSLLQNKF